MPRFPDLPCADCGTMMWRGTGSLPEGEARCRPCRRANPTVRSSKPNHQTPCVDCAKPSYGVRCKACDIALRQLNVDPEASERRRILHARRAARDKAAPGLSQPQRIRLLNRWKAQGKSCTYCPAPVASVDHVIPLALGGTNLEGNLTPACLDCNNRKSDSLLIEWKHKRKTRRERVRVEVVLPKPRVRKPRVWMQASLKQCELCDALHFRSGKYCGDQCAVEANRIRNRNLYRMRTGIPIDTPLRGIIRRAA